MSAASVNYGKFSALERLTLESLTQMDKHLMFEQQLGTINLRLRTVLDFPPEHNCAYGDESQEMVYVRLSDLFDQKYHQFAKHFFYYLITSADLAVYIRQNCGFGLHNNPLGDNSVVMINRLSYNRVNHKAQTIINAWRQYKLVSRIICNF